MKTRINRTLISLSVLAAFILLPAFSQNPAAPGNGPEFTSDGQLKFPEHYREWIYLTSGFDMSYNPAMKMGHHMFDNVFVNPAAYKAFVETGTWPDKTVLFLEVRGTRPCCFSKSAEPKIRAPSTRWAIIRARKPWGSKPT